MDRGHQRIAFVGRDRSYGSHGQARRGYEAGLQAAGIRPDPKLAPVCTNTDALNGFLAARDMFQLPDPPTAIITARDTLAEGVCRAAEDRNLRVGRDVSVIGFDHTTWPTGEEFLTTFHEPCYEMGGAAMEMLAARIVNPLLPDSKRKFDTPLVDRRSLSAANEMVGRAFELRDETRA